MKRIRRSLSILLILVMTQSLLAQWLLGRAYAESLYQDPLALLPDWADQLGGGYDPAAPPNPLAGLMPKNPLEGVIPQLPTPKAPAVPGTGAPAQSSAPGPQAPGDIRVPNAAPAPDCGCSPDTVKAATGALEFSVRDLLLPGVGPELALTRRYSSTAAAKDGPFGYGWDFDLNNRLQMYVFHHITELRGDGSRTSFDYTKAGGFLDSYDGDPEIHTDLSLGHYTPTNAPGWSLVREAADRYVVTRPDGTVYTYRGYHAPWRTGQDPRAGRLLAIRDRNGNALTFEYNPQGQLTTVSDVLGRPLTFTWTGSHITRAADHAGRVFTYTYTGSDLVQVESLEHPTYKYAHDPSTHRLTNRSGGPEGTVGYQYDTQGRVIAAGLATYSYEDGQTTYTDSAGQPWVFTLDGARRITKVKGPEGLITTTAYDSQGRVDMVTEPVGTTDFEYDEAGRPAEVSRNGITTKTTYGAWGLPTKIETPTGTLELRYDPANGNLLGRKEPGQAEATFTYDAKGRLLTETSPGGQVIEYSYDDKPHVRPTLTKQVSPDQGTVTLKYDGAGRLQLISGPVDSEVRYDYDARGRVETLTIKDGPTYTFGYDGVGRLTSAKDHHSGKTATWSRYKDGRVQVYTSLRNVETTYSYDDRGRLKTVAGPAGSISYDLDDQGRVTAVSGPGVRKVEYGYDASGRINRATMAGITVSAELDYRGRQTRVTTPTGTTEYAFDAAGRLSRVTYPDRRWVSVEYDELERTGKTTTSSGLVTTYAYMDSWVFSTDSLKRKTTQLLNHRGQPTLSQVSHSETGKVAQVSSFEYDQAGRVTSIKQGDGPPTILAYDAAGRLISRKDGAGKSTAYAYDPHGRVVKVTDRRDKVTEYEYDLAANTVIITAPGLSAATFTYDDANRISQAVDSAGTSTQWAYHPEGNLKSLTRSGVASRTKTPASASWSWTYDAAGRSEKATDPLGAITEYHYDGLGRLEWVQDGLQQKTAYTYDKLNRLESVTTPRGGTTTYSYDPKGRLEAVRDAAGGEWTYGYDAADRVVSRSNPLKVLTSFDYTPAGQLAQVSQPVDGQRTAVIGYGYDTAGRMAVVTDARKQERSFTYDDAGRLHKVLAPLGQTFEYDYDPEGNLALSTDPMKRQTAYEYDVGGRLTLLTRHDGTKTAYRYDAAGRIEWTATGASETSFFYDGLGRLEAEKDPRGHLTSFVYDGAGNLLKRTDAQGKVTEFSYDALGRLTRETDRREHFTQYEYNVKTGTTKVTDKQGEAWVYQFDAAGRLSSLSAPGDRVTSYGYDLAGRLTSVADPMGNLRSFGYNDAGWLVEVKETEGPAAREAAKRLDLPAGYEITPTRTQTFLHDLAGNVVKSTDPAGLTIEYAYDELGRRVKASWPAPGEKIAAETWDYYADDRVKSHTSATGGVTAYAYDNAARLSSVTDPNGNTFSFAYNFRGQVTARTDADGTTGFEYDLAGNLVKFIDPRSKEIVTEYSYDELNRLLEVRDPEGGVQKFGYDPEGNVRERLDARGQTWLYEYDKLGRLTTREDPNGHKTTYDYAPSGRVKSVEDALGRLYEFEYDALDRLIEQKLPGDIRQAIAYDWRSNPVARTDGRGNTTYSAYDGADRMTAIYDPEGGITRYTWDVRGFLTDLVDANGTPTSFERDPLGRLLSETNGEGEKTSYTYDPAGNALQKTDPAGQVRTYSYNQRGQITRIDYSGQEQAEFQYDASGNLVRAANPAAVEEYTYDKLNRLTKVENLTLEKSTQFAYDGAGLRTSITDPEGLTTDYKYDKAGRLEQATLPDGLVTSFSWDQVDRLTSIQRSNGVTTEFTYNDAGSIEQVSHTGPGGLIGSYTYEYDGNGNKTKQTEEDGAVTTWSYDKLNRLVEVTYPKQKIEAIRAQYFSAPKAYRPAREGETEDPLLEEEQAWAPAAKGPSAAESVRPFYTIAAKGGNGGGPSDNGGGQSNNDSAPSNNGGGQGNNDSAPSNNGGGQGNNDSAPSNNGGGQGNNDSVPSNNGGGQSNNDSAPSNNGGGQSNNGGGQSNNGGGQSNDKEKGENGKGGADKPDKSSGKPDGLEPCPTQRTKPERAQPKKSSTGVKSYLEAPEYLVTPTSKVSYTYDKIGNRLSMETDQSTTAYTYDKASRLLKAGATSYSYDRAGNLISQVTPDEEITYSYNAAGKLTRVDREDETYVAFAYDAFGRKVRRTESAWVSKGNPHGTPPGLTDAKGWGNNSDGPAPGQGKAGENGKSAENGKGKEKPGPCAEEEAAPAKKEPPGRAKSEAHKQLKLAESTTSYLYDGLGLNLLKEYKDRSAPKAEYYYANGQVLARKMFGLKGEITPDREAGLANGGTYYYLTDALGSVTDLTDHQGAVVRKYRYDAFGGLFTGGLGVYNTVGLTGKSYDAKAGLMDYSARWYDPTVGRFTQVDPFSGWLDLPQSRNPFAYVMNNPVMYTDPTGRATNVTASPGSVLQGESVTISWFYNDFAHPTIVEIYRGGELVGSGSGSGKSGSMSWSTWTAGEYSVWVYPDDEFSQFGDGDSFTVRERPPTNTDPDPGDDGGDDGGEDDGDEDEEEEEEEPHIPVIREEHGPWQEVNRVHGDPRERVLEEQIKVVTQDVTIYEERWAKKYSDDQLVESWTDERSWQDSFTRQFNWVAGNWILDSEQGNPGALSPEEQREYTIQKSDLKTYNVTGVRPETTLTPGASAGVDCSDTLAGCASATGVLSSLGLTNEGAQFYQHNSSGNLTELMNLPPDELQVVVAGLNRQGAYVASGQYANDQRDLKYGGYFVVGTGVVVVSAAAAPAALTAGTAVVDKAAVALLTSPFGMYVYNQLLSNGDDYGDVVGSCAAQSGLDTAICAKALVNLAVNGDQPSPTGNGGKGGGSGGGGGRRLTPEEAKEILVKEAQAFQAELKAEGKKPGAAAVSINMETGDLLPRQTSQSAKNIPEQVSVSMAETTRELEQLKMKAEAEGTLNEQFPPQPEHCCAEYQVVNQADLNETNRGDILILVFRPRNGDVMDPCGNCRVTTQGANFVTTDQIRNINDSILQP